MSKTKLKAEQKAKAPRPRPTLAARAIIAALLSAAFAGATAAQEQRQEGASKSAPGVLAAATAPAPPGEHYRIGPGDVLEVRVFNRPQLSREAVRVEGDGMIRMPLVEGEVRAACLTEGELAEEIARRYLKYLKNPQVDVFIKEYNSTPVAVIGAVAAPGRFQLQRRVRLLELLAFAGGPTERAGRSVQVVHSAPLLACDADGAGRATTANGEAAEVSSYELGETLLGGSQSNPFVRPGDVITIPEAAQVYVVGNVLKPSAIPLKERVTVSQAIAMAGGALHDTQSERVRVVRQGPGGVKTEIVVDLKAISRRRAEDLALQPNDIVEVPTASGKRFLRTLLGSVVPSAARLPVQIIR